MGRMSNEGQRLRAVLERHGRRPTELAAALKRTRQSVHIYLSTPTFSPNTRAKIREALETMGIDPSEIDPAPTAKIANAGELRALLARIPRKALPDVKAMLEITDRATRIGLLALIEDRIERDE